MTVRVVIVDDSPFVREILRAGLARFPDLEIVGEAADGLTAERLVATLRPDVVTMDVVMPLVGGFEAIRSIMASHPTPIVVVSDARAGHERLAFEAISAGAVEVFAKPPGGFDERAASELAATLRSSARARIAPLAEVRAPAMPSERSIAARLRTAAIVGVVTSTGGPQALRALLSALPATFPLPIAIVQHTSIGFTAALAKWLDGETALTVEVARAGQAIRGVVVAPDDYHMEIDRRGEIVLHRSPPLRGHRPSGTTLLRSLASHGAAAVGIVGTGMGDDGSQGLSELELAGGVAMIEDPQLAVIAAMPRAAIHATRAGVVASMPRLAELLVLGCMERR